MEYETSYFEKIQMATAETIDYRCFEDMQISHLAAAASACVVQQFGTNFHRICEAQTPGNSLSVALSAGYSNVLMAGGTFDIDAD